MGTLSCFAWGTHAAVGVTSWFDPKNMFVYTILLAMSYMTWVGGSFPQVILILFSMSFCVFEYVGMTHLRWFFCEVYVYIYICKHIIYIVGCWSQNLTSVFCVQTYFWLVDQQCVDCPCILATLLATFKFYMFPRWWQHHSSCCMSLDDLDCHWPLTYNLLD